jgi:hypothetical protein
MLTVSAVGALSSRKAPRPPLPQGSTSSAELTPQRHSGCILWTLILWLGNNSSKMRLWFNGEVGFSKIKNGWKMSLLCPNLIVGPTEGSCVMLFSISETADVLQMLTVTEWNHNTIPGNRCFLGTACSHTWQHTCVFDTLWGRSLG